MTMARKLLFLPAASGDMQLWARVSARIDHPARRVFVGWPGFGGVPNDPDVRGFDDLVERLLRELDEPVDVLAQSMGGAVALHAALRRPAQILRLVLAVTSGGVDVTGLGGCDWRPALLRSLPELPRWFVDHRSDLSEALPRLTIPTLLLWGDRDPISPVAVGERLSSLLPCARLRVFSGADHDLVRTHAEQVAPYIEAHLRAEPPSAGVGGSSEQC